jgi:murein DD-endopeptidase MepM/ murein hydrolase activator NlpD
MGSIRKPVTHSPAPLSEIDSAVHRLQSFGDLVKARADSAYVGEALSTLLEMRQREAAAVMSRWAQDTGIHEGVDLGAPLGAKVTAIHACVVVEVGIEGYGDQAVRLRERDVDVILGHLSKAVVRPGQRLRRGQLVGYVGETGGISTGPHIHIEVRPKGGGYGSALDPMPYLQSADRPEGKKRSGSDDK